MWVIRTFSTTALFTISLVTLFAQALVQQGDFVYLGAFRLPTDMDGGSRFGYGGTAPVYHAQNHSLFMVGHDWDQKVAEVSIPELVISDDIDDLNTGEMLQPFRDISEGLMYTVDEGTIKVGGLLVHDGKLIGSAWTYYDADGSQVYSHCISDTNITIEDDALGMYALGEIGAGFVSGYMSMIPESWQEAFGGVALTGQCCIPIISRSSYGPAAFVFNPDSLGLEDPLDVNPLVYYPDEHPLAPWNSTGPYFNGTTNITGVVIPQDRRSVLFFGSHGIGEFCYGTGDQCNDPVNDSQGTHAYPYVFQVWAYDILDLLDVKNGVADPWNIVPYDVWTFDFPITEENKQLGGATYDPESGIIYVSQLRIDGFDAFPIVHAFSLRGPHLYVDSTATSELANGVSWNTAFATLQDALAVANTDDTIHIAKGTYYPDEGALQTNGNPEHRFIVHPDVVILGGYPSGGGTADPSQHRVILSGDIDENDLASPALHPDDVLGNNAYRVIECDGCELNGLTITAGKANGTVTAGAGLYATGNNIISQCLISGNIANGNGMNGRGGGLFTGSGVTTLREVTLQGNFASEGGSAWYAATGSLVVDIAVNVK